MMSVGKFPVGTKICRTSSSMVPTFIPGHNLSKSTRPKRLLSIFQRASCWPLVGPTSCRERVGVISASPMSEWRAVHGQGVLSGVGLHYCPKSHCPLGQVRERTFRNLVHSWAGGPFVHWSNRLFWLVVG